jgi:hypothetical protein
MEADISSVGDVCCAGLCHWNAGNVHAYVVDGVDHVESCDGDLSGRPGMPCSDNTGPGLACQAVLCERMEIVKAQVCDHVSGFMVPKHD